MTKLTKRQKEVLEGVMNGATSSEIAKALGLKERTVKMHLSAVYREKGVASKFELVTREYKEQVRHSVNIMRRIMREIDAFHGSKYIKIDIENYFKKWGLK